MSDATPPQSAGRRMGKTLAIYTLARLALVAVLAAIILGVAAIVKVDIPAIVALLFALLIALPLSLLVFKKLRTQLNRDIAAFDEKRRSDKEQLMSRLRGEEK